MVQKIFLILLLLVTTSFSQKKIRIVDSSSKKPIAEVVIYTPSANLVSDKTGIFYLIQFNDDDSISFSHVAYVKKVLYYSELQKLSQIELTKKQISTEQVDVIAKNNYEDSIINESIELNEFEKNSFASTAEILKSKTSLLIRDYGGEGSTKTISARGMSSENTLVLFNEARVNDLRTGSFDFSLLDIFAIDKIEYVKNNSAENITAGGVLKITSQNLNRQNSATIGAMFNSNLTQKYFGKVNYSKNNFSFGSNLVRSFSPNRYNYIFENKKERRQNAQYSKTFINADVRWSSSNLVIKFYTHYSHLLNGLPGFVVTNNTTSSLAQSLTNSLLSIANINYSISKKSTFLSTLSYHNQYLRMYDPQNQLLIDRNSQSSTFTDLSFASKLSYKLDKLDLLFGYNISNANVDSLTTYISGIFNSNNGKRTEQNIHTSAKYFFNSEYFDDLNISGGVNYQIVDEDIYSNINHYYLSYKLGLSFTPLFSRDTEVLATFSNNYRHPTFNEKYYSGFFGNSELSGEDYKSINIGIKSKLHLLESEEIEITYFSILGNNKIIWAPTILAIQIPRNVSKINSNGIELKFMQSLFNSMLDWELLYTYTNARNISALSEDDNTYNKQIIYTPVHRANINVNFRISNFILSANSSIIGKRYYTPDNTERNKLSPYFLLDLSASYEFAISSTENVISVNAYNILDEEYFVIQSYPMPLKTISINYNVRLK